MRNSGLHKLRSAIISFREILILLCLFTFLFSFSSCTGGFKDSDFPEEANYEFDEKSDSVFSVLLNYYNEDTDSAILKAIESEEQFIREKRYSDLVRLYSFLSEVYQYRKNDDYKALEYITKGIDIVAAHPDLQFDRTFLYINVGNIMYRYKLFDEAIYIYREVPKITDAGKKPGVMALIYNNIALSFQAMHECDTAKYYFDLTEKFIEESGISAAILKIQHYYYRSSLSLDCGEIDSIPVYYNKTETLFAGIDSVTSKYSRLSYIKQYWHDVSLNYYINKIRLLDKMAEYYKLKGDAETAMTYYARALDYSKISKDCVRGRDIFIGMSDACILLGNYDSALRYLDSALNQQGCDNTDYEGLSKIYIKESDIFEFRGDSNNAIECRKFADLYADSLKHQKFSDELVLKKMELAVKPVQLAMKNIELSRNDKIRTIENQNLIINFLLAVFIFISFALFIYYRLYKNLKKTQRELATRTIEKLKITNPVSAEKNKLSDAVEQDLLIKFEEEVLNKKAFLESNLTLNVIAEKLETNRSYISRIINTVYGMNFNDYINKLRINEACTIICNNTNPNFTIDHLFSEVGFTGKSTFYAAFKKYTGVTPAVFFKMNNMTGDHSELQSG